MLTPEQEQECARLKALFNEKAGMSQRAFAAKYKLGTVSNLSQYLTGRRALSLPLAIKLATILEVEVSDFSPRLAKEATSLGIPLGPSGNTALYLKPQSQKIPVLSYAQCGAFTSSGQVKHALAAIDAGDFVYGDVDLPDDCFALYLRGESMEPEFSEGDTVIIDPGLNPSPGDFVIAVVNDPTGEDPEATFKKYRPRGLNDHGREYFELVPLNEDYPVIRSDKQPCTIIGVLIEHRRPFRRRRS